MKRKSTSDTSRSSDERHVQVRDRNESCRTGLASGLAIIGGAAVGATLMYLLDPDEGADRRSKVRSMAGNAASSAGSALESGWSSMRDGAERVYHAAGEGASAFKEKLSDGASAVGEKLSEGADYVTDNRYARRLSKSARRARDEASDRFGYLVHGRRGRGLESGLSQGLAAAACLGLGVGAMYFLDPRDGARRRRAFRDKFLSAFGRMASQLEKQGRNIWNRASGMVYEARSGLSREQVDVHSQPGSTEGGNSFTRGGARQGSSRPMTSAPLCPPGTTAEGTQI